ncbi:mitochondrial metalloendopeptidase OMA1-like [Bidens hawaiensis]|uniref:mitochondrial metalloendopeptidase OMA1-like n=1 Tax=Bidens hawaiensis TaxID=980011 RepID=UPI0040495EFE
MQFVVTSPNPQSRTKYYCSIRAPNASSSSKRYYYAVSRQVRHFKPPWTNNPRKVLMVVLAGSGIGLTMYFGNLESIPYTQRSHMVLMPHNLEKQMGESQFQKLKDGFKGKLLPPMHPDTRRVRMIARDIIQALPRGFNNKQQTDEVNIDDNHDETRDNNNNNNKSAISYLEGLVFEVLVVDDHAVNACPFPGGKIVVSTGLLQHLKTDQEIAAIIGHEVAHLVARHTAEQIQKNLWSTIRHLILWCRLVMRDNWFVAVPYVLLKLPFSKRMEIEADYIGLLLMASAGYDPRVAPNVFEKLGQASGAFGDCLFTHSCGKERSKLLDEASVMEEAVSIYREAIAGREVDGFLV